jgi:hypothetical protein
VYGLLADFIERKRMTVTEQIARLKLHSRSSSSEAELKKIEELSGLALSSSFRELWSAVGECIVGAKIRSGLQAGQDVCEFWGAGKIIEKLNEDRLSRVVPFGEDIWGNWFFIDETGSVKLVDWNANRVEPVSASLDQFLESLDPP